MNIVNNLNEITSEIDKSVKNKQLQKCEQIFPSLHKRCQNGEYFWSLFIHIGTEIIGHKPNSRCRIKEYLQNCILQLLTRKVLIQKRKVSNFVLGVPHVWVIASLEIKMKQNGNKNMVHFLQDQKYGPFKEKLKNH